MEKKYLTLEQAQELVFYIKKDLVKLMNINKALSLLDSIEIEYEDDYKTFSQEILFNKKFHKLSFVFYSLLEKLQLKGCVVRDLDSGFVDFYSFFQGREICLLWNVSNDKIKYWYEADLDYRARKPISMLQKELRNK